jgi:hypothetical protein
VISDDDAAPDGPAMPLADWRRPSQEQRIDAVPAHLRERLAATVERVAATFTLAAPWRSVPGATVQRRRPTGRR